MKRCRDHSTVRSIQQRFETSTLQWIPRAIPQEVNSQEVELITYQMLRSRKHESVPSTPRNPQGLVRFSADKTSNYSN